MYKFTIKQKGGFCSPSSIVKIYDKKGNVFYSHENKRGGKIHFNLPAGTYKSEERIKPYKFRVYKTRKPYKPERTFPLPEKFTFKYVENPNKCTIYLDRGLIIWDKDFFNSLLKPEKVFILFHEIGHYFYSTEKKCDVFAAYYMLKMGYNPSQIFKSQNITLSNKPHTIERKINVFETLKKTQL